MYYIVYQTLNTVNNKIYVGVHITSNLEDGYLGSGKILSRAINKHGVDKFIKQVLHVFDNMEDMFAKEAEIVNEEFINRSDTYNIKLGGNGGWDFVNKQGLNFTYEKNNKISGFKNVPQETRKLWQQQATQAFIDKYELFRQGLIPDPHPNREAFTFKGKSHTDKTKAAMSTTHKERGSGKGEKNSQYGTCWVHNRETNKKIDKDELNHYLNQGWTRGRINVHKK